MGLETGTYISALNASNPVSSDAKTEGDDHLRLIKSTLLATFPNITGAVTPTHTELNYVDGVTSAIQTQLNAKAPIANPALTGNVVTHSYAGDVAQGVLYFSQDLSKYILNDGTSFTISHGLQSAGLLKGNGGGSGLGKITASTSGPSGTVAGDLWLRW